MIRDSAYCIHYEEGCRLKPCEFLCSRCKGYFKPNKKNRKDADNTTAAVQPC